MRRRLYGAGHPGRHRCAPAGRFATSPEQREATSRQVFSTFKTRYDMRENTKTIIRLFEVASRQVAAKPVLEGRWRWLNRLTPTRPITSLGIAGPIITSGQPSLLATASGVSPGTSATPSCNVHTPTAGSPSSFTPEQPIATPFGDTINCPLIVSPGANQAAKVLEPSN